MFRKIFEKQMGPLLLDVDAIQERVIFLESRVDKLEKAIKKTEKDVSEGKLKRGRGRPRKNES